MTNHTVGFNNEREVGFLGIGGRQRGPQPVQFRRFATQIALIIKEEDLIPTCASATGRERTAMLMTVVTPVRKRGFRKLHHHARLQDIRRQAI